MAVAKVVVYFVASREVDVQVPESVANSQDPNVLPEYVQEILNEDLPDVHSGSSFEFPIGFVVPFGDDEWWDLDDWCKE